MSNINNNDNQKEIEFYNQEKMKEQQKELLEEIGVEEENTLPNVPTKISIKLSKDYNTYEISQEYPNSDNAEENSKKLIEFANKELDLIISTKNASTTAKNNVPYMPETSPYVPMPQASRPSTPYPQQRTYQPKKKWTDLAVDRDNQPKLSSNGIQIRRWEAKELYEQGKKPSDLTYDQIRFYTEQFKNKYEIY